MMRFKRSSISSDTYGTEVLAKSKKIGVNSSKKDKWEATASQTGMQNTSVSQMPIEVDVDPLLKDIIFSEDLEQKRLVNRLYRDIYYNDAVCGSAVDMLSTLPFSDFTLGGISDRRATHAFQQTIERLNVRTILPHMSTDHLVDGAFVGSLLFNRTSKRFFDIMPHRYDNTKIDSLPFYGQDPIITAAIPDNIRASLSSDSDRVQRLRERLGEDIINLLQQEAIELDPITTIYMPRKTFTTGEGVSFFRRVLPIYLLEKNLFRGTLVESSRRQRGILHLSLGDGDQWEPTVADMEFITELFMNADADPLGAIIATRLGVSADELRQGGDFWKVTDTWDGTATFKLRALGISESFLSGEANYACLTGDSLIPTDKGLLYIDQMVDEKHLPKDTSESLKDIEVPLDITVQSRYSNEKTSSWKYSGYTDTLKVVAENGASVTATANHPFLVFTESGDIKWIPAGKLKNGDMLCMPSKGLLRQDRLELDAYSTENNISFPTEMSPQLAYLVGRLLFSRNALNTDKVLLQHPKEKLQQHTYKLFRDVFGIEPTYSSPEDSKNTERKIPYSYCVEVQNSALLHWFGEIGVGKDGSTRIPWSILRADGESQLAFVAALLDSMEYVHDAIVFYALDAKIKQQLQILLFSHGILSTIDSFSVCLSREQSAALRHKMSRYSVFFTQNDRTTKSADNFGFSAMFLIDFLAARQVSKNIFLNDDNEIVEINEDFDFIGNTFTYDRYDKGEYDFLLRCLRRISKYMYRRIVYLFDLRYLMVPITSVYHGGKQHVYDISMRPGVEPAFVANGIVVHNTADTSLTVFIESIRAYRDMLTRRLFYNKIFPLVSLVNGFTVNDRGKLIRKDGLLQSGNMQANIDRLADGTRLLIPNVHWSKQLKPEGDSQYMDMLQQLTEKGIPVPLRAIAAAGGFNLDSLLSDSADDIELLRRVSEHNSKIAEVKKKFGPKEAEEEMGGFASGGQDELESILNRSGSVLSDMHGRRPSLSERDFGEASEITDQTRTGKKRHVYNQRAAQERANRRIAKAVGNIVRTKKTHLTHDSVTPRKSNKKSVF